MFEAAELGQNVDRAAFEAEVPLLRESLLDLQFRLREAPCSVIVLVNGVEGAGKGETVNCLLEWLDARGVSTRALGLPSKAERRKPWLDRYWRELPATGQMLIFFGSWYTRPIVDRAQGRIDEARFELELNRIVEFERMLAEERTLLLKFWFHVSQREQRRKFRRLERDPDTAWRVTPRDWKYHKLYETFRDICARAIRRTSTGHAPWEIVDAAHKRYRHLTVGRRIRDALEQRLSAPPAEPPRPEPLPVPGEQNLIRSLDLSQRVDEAEYAAKLPKLQGRLARLSRRLGPARRSAVVVFEGADAAGKGGAIRRLVQALDARFYRVVPISAPSDEERARPYLWRFWRRLPETGQVTVFDRSWYGRVLVERIEGFCRPDEWRRAFAEINAFEEQLVEGGVALVKFWLAISPEEQWRRFQAREATGYKRYKLTDEDLRNREKWPAYEAAACDVFEKTSTELAPWTLVEAEDKNFARLKVLRTVAEAWQRALD